ncbi:phosphoglycolate phosphatase [Allopontixanthobacter sp.]|uniref:phosphoglycolate phosphatase n=1 Tax=Allopontixanthobacter sp. TaxID=2906452 RepID=UPI002AB82043|nr:phosphoglycolate phosphatase [Allopontixanthobacter sp.]MDZ4308845.1 phosphoglycolate phosphatase [Allopontixanthobacter sp.]
MTADFADLLVIFDLDGTLVDTAPDLLGALNHVLAEEGLPPVALDEVRHMMGHGAAALLAHGHLAAGRTWHAQDQSHCVERLIGHYRENIAVESGLFPGAAAVLYELERRGARFAICTNKPTHLARLLLTELGIAARFAAIVGSDLGQPRKPDPRHLLHTIESVAHHAGPTVMIGDSLNDVEAARGCGIPCIAMRFGYLDRPVEELGADAIVESYDRLIDAIVELLGDMNVSGATMGIA